MPEQVNYNVSDGIMHNNKRKRNQRESMKPCKSHLASDNGGVCSLALHKQSIERPPTVNVRSTQIISQSQVTNTSFGVMKKLNWVNEYMFIQSNN